VVILPRAGLYVHPAPVPVSSISIKRSPGPATNSGLNSKSILVEVVSKLKEVLATSTLP
jgi:hypothetical protein